MNAEHSLLKLGEALARAEMDRCQALEIAQGTKAKLKAIDTECKQAKGKVHRLRSQLVRAHVCGCCPCKRNSGERILNGEGPSREARGAAFTS